MARVEADFLDRKRIVFTARGRSQVNVRETGTDGETIGFTSTELMLIGLANCSLGVVMNDSSLADIDVARMHATVDGEMASDPSRISRIRLVVEVESEDPALLRAQPHLYDKADNCPMGNTFRMATEIEVQVVVKTPPIA